RRSRRLSARLSLDQARSKQLHMPIKRSRAAAPRLALNAAQGSFSRPGGRTGVMKDRQNGSKASLEDRRRAAVCERPLASTLADASPSPARVRPGDPAWPSEESWDQLGREMGGRLIKVRSPLAACVGASSDAACAQVFKELKNPYYLGDEVGLTQSLGWVGAWTSEPSVYAVAAKTTAD